MMHRDNRHSRHSEYVTVIGLRHPCTVFQVSRQSYHYRPSIIKPPKLVYIQAKPSSIHVISMAVHISNIPLFLTIMYLSTTSLYEEKEKGGAAHTHLYAAAWIILNPSDTSLVISSFLCGSSPIANATSFHCRSVSQRPSLAASFSASCLACLSCCNTPR